MSQEHYEIASSRARNLPASKHILGLILWPLDSVRWHVVDHPHSSVSFFAAILGAVIMLSSWKFCHIRAHKISGAKPTVRFSAACNDIGQPAALLGWCWDGC
jgi:hypothetical protein